ncbi:predicted protein [Cyanophage PSS2]|uniref:hypothetical protein n=1 Tax=Cyanophage PSS2 TaxID=658401 RepID=UPI0001B04031|nr:hypothetical protein [Cyanophage PSS2]ACT65652.1 hypothetical protein [Cyanophage PSS2]ACY75793.1 predicted protein [Cyanophage PSS2]
MADFTLEHVSMAEEVSPRADTYTVFTWLFTGSGTSSMYSPVVGRRDIKGIERDIIYTDGDVRFAGWQKGFQDVVGGGSGYVPTWMSADYVAVWPTYANAIQHIGESEWDYKGIFGNNQIANPSGGGGGSVRPTSGFIYPRRI